MNNHKHIKFLALLILFLLLIGCTPEEEKAGIIYGTVSDFFSGEPISNVNVRLNPRGETTLTGMDGAFQFNDLAVGSYSLSLSKNGYVDVDDDYVIKIENGNAVERSIQMQKLSSSIQIVDNNGNVIDILDFGANESVTQRTFNIFNNGNVSFDFAIDQEANWVKEVIPSSGRVGVGDTKPISVIIDRTYLGSGENRTTLTITTPSAGGVDVIVSAILPISPTVETGEITDVNNNSAKCSGDVTDNGGVSVTEKGICYSRTENPSIDGLRVSGGTGNGSFTCSLTGLEENATYYIQAYATNGVSTAFGVPKHFTTSGRPKVSTVDYSNVSASSAICSGDVTSECGSSVTERGICYGLSSNPTINNNIVLDSGTGIGSFTCELKDLTNNTLYYVRAYAKNQYGVAYGEEISFRTEILPTFQYGGYTYYVAPDPGILMYWNEANSYCNNLSVHGLTGWRMPDMYELLQMYADRESIGGFFTSWESNNRYWSSTYAGPYTNSYYYVSFYSGNIYNGEDDQMITLCTVRAIRRKN